MWRRLFCVLAFLASFYCLGGSMHAGWLTAADPEQVELHRMWFYVWLMARVSERNSKARETGGLSIARRWSAPCVSMVRVL